MANVTVKVLEPAISIDFLTLEEAKLLLNITDTSQDQLLAMQISIYSATVAEMANRTFAREKVQETWRELYNGRLFLTHWPVKEIDIESVWSAGSAHLPFELEEGSGKLENVGPYDAESTSWPQAVTVVYTGGFILPDEAPLPLKQATALLIRDQKQQAQIEAVAGIRQISHKESRVTFFDPNQANRATGTTGRSASYQAAENLVKQYTRFWM
jgi:hypothetical protein